MRMEKNISALWLWPWTAYRANIALFETMMGVPEVIGARMPLIGTAMREPWSADYAELTGMITEKVAAFGLSNDTFGRTSDAVRNAIDATTRTWSTVLSGKFPTFSDAARATERNISAFAALVALPGAMIAPVHSQVTRNVRRFRRG